MKTYEKIGLIIIGFALLFEVLVIGISYFNADEIECNFLWCTFKTERTTVDSRQSCSINGKEVNCSDFANDYPDSFYHHGETSINGVCLDDDWNACVKQAIRNQEENNN